MNITLIAAISPQPSGYVIGENGAIPWDLPGDRLRFRRLTMGKPVIMGRKTFESIGRPLDGRWNIILGRSGPHSVQGRSFHNVPDIREALRIAGMFTDSEVMVIGGQQIYEQFMPYATTMHLTIVDGNYAGDTFFPRFGKEWAIAECRDRCIEERNGIISRYEIYTRENPEIEVSHGHHEARRWHVPV